LASVQTKILKSPTNKLKRFARGLPGGGDRRPIAELAGKGRALIIARTQAGKDADGAAFQEYSRKTYYAPIKDGQRPAGYPKPSGGRTEHARTGKPLETVAYDGGYGEYKRGIGRSGKVDLTVSGQMLNAIAFRVQSAKVAELYFSSREEAAKAHGHHFGTVVPGRSFFDLSGFKTEADMTRHLATYMRRLAREAKLRLEGVR
jgi:hypothetical protein